MAALKTGSWAAPSPRVQLALLLALTAALLMPGMDAQYVWDDQNLILRNPHLATARIGWLLSGDLWAGVGDSAAHFYRPLMLASLLVDRALGLGPWGAQLHSLGWHLASVGLLVLFLRRHVSPGAALLGGTLLALHPAQSSVVRFVAARNDPMALSLVLVAALALERKELRFQILAGLATLAALLSKETALAALPALALLHRPKRLIGPGVAVLIWMALRAQAELDSPRLALEGSTLLRGASQALECALWTPGCSPMMAPSQLEAFAPLGLLLLGLVALGCWKGGRLAWAGATWFLLTGAAGLLGALIADGLGWRYANLPLAGLALILAAQPWPEDRALLASGGLAALLAVPLWIVLPQWQSTATLWEKAYALQPGPPTACGLFKVYELRGQDQQAAGLLPETFPQSHCCYNASRFHLDRGRPARARALGQQALDAGCAPSPELTAPAALAAALMGDWDEAERWVAMNPADPYGYTPLVESAAALRRGDRSVLERYAAQPAPEGAKPLEEQVEWLLHQSSTPSP